MRRRRFSQGSFWKMAACLLERADEPIDEALLEILKDGASEGELFCSSMLYDIFFDLDNWPIEQTVQMFSYLDAGMEQGFWLSFYQAADLLQRLDQLNVKTDWATNRSPSFLLRQARDKFQKLPIVVSDVTLRDIEEKRLRLWIKST